MSQNTEESGKLLPLPEFRSLDDFILSSSRFQLPPYRDLDKWANRIVSNLIYYQTNYFALILVIFLIIGVFHPAEMLYGFLSLALAFAVFAYATSRMPEAIEFKKNHPIVSLCLILGAGYLLVTMFSSVIVFLFGIALPMLLMFLHSSTRLRSFGNKVTSKLEAAGLKTTPMGRLLDVIGIRPELISF